MCTHRFSSVLALSFDRWNSSNTDLYDLDILGTYAKRVCQKTVLNNVDRPTGLFSFVYMACHCLTECTFL